MRFTLDVFTELAQAFGGFTAACLLMFFAWLAVGLIKWIVK